MSGDALSADEIRESLGTTILGKALFAYNSLDSTNGTAKILARSGAPEGSLVVAEEQKRGKGRFDRGWYSPGGVGIWFSVILKPDMKPERAPALSVLVGLSVVEAIRAHTGLPVLLRWPNDVIFQGRKLCGVLTEIEPDFVVLGVGVNVNNPSFPPEFAAATSLRIELGRCFNRVELLCQLLSQLESNYLLFLEGKSLEPLLGRVRGLSSVLGGMVSVSMSIREDSLCGEAMDIDEEGRLVLRLDSGSILTLIAGEVKRVGGR